MEEQRDMLRLSRSHRRRLRGHTHRTLFRVELLEDRSLLAGFMVTTTADTGAGSLRQAILDSNATPGPNTIDFKIGTGEQSISPLSPLPSITTPVTIDGTTQPGYTGTPVITIDGTRVTGDGLVLGLTATSSSAGSTIKGLRIELFSGSALIITTDSNLVESNILGFNGTGIELKFGLSANPVTQNTIGGSTNGDGNDIIFSGRDGIEMLIGSDMNAVEGNIIEQSGGNGVEISNASHNVIGGTVTGAGNSILSNSGNGVLIAGTFASDNVVEGNDIGTDGTFGAPNSNGVVVSSSSNTIGGTTVAARNVISANTQDGVLITGNQNVVEGNYVGTGETGTEALGNGSSGVEVNSSSDNTIGGVSGTAGNLILGNRREGILITNLGGTNSVVGNTIRANSDNGIWISDFTHRNTIGGISGNDISDNLGDDVLIQSSSSNVLAGNVLNASLRDGVEITGISISNTIGGTTAPAGNLIENLLADGVAIESPLAQLNILEGNRITENAIGVELIDSIANVIGGTAAGAGNVISQNHGNGISISALATKDLVLGNFIGTDASGQFASPNGVDGVDLNGAAFITIGGTASGAGNVISGNLGSGIKITTNATGVQVLGNDIGTNAAGSSPLPNGSFGVYLTNATSNTIGGIGAGSRNVISGNAASGIGLEAGATNNQVLGNDIGTDSTGLKSLPNGVDGVDLDKALADTVGGSAAGAGNLISGNAGNGISLTAGATSIQVLGNFIGTDSSGTKSLPNAGDGVNFASVAGNTIGGTATGDRNVVSGNAGSGIDFTSAANDNLVVGNYVGTDVSGESPLGNVNGISITSAMGNTVGGIAPGAVNIISGNTSIGIQISNVLARDNTVLGNLIGTDRAGARVLLSPNATTGFPVGILINDSPSNLIGGTMAGAGNVISGFGVAVNISAFNASGNAIQGNLIGTAQNGQVLTNADVIGIYINGAGENLVGGGTSAAGNTIMGYTDYGVYLFGSQSAGNVVQGNRIGQRVTIRELAAKHPTQQLAGVGIQGASSNLIGGATRAMGNTIQGNAEAGVYIFGRANSASNNKIKNNLFENNAYGILLFNAPNNGQYFTLLRTNRFKKNPIANVREFTGPVPSATSSSKKTATRDRKPGHREIRAESRRHHSPQLRDDGKARRG
jgi:titin